MEGGGGGSPDAYLTESTTCDRAQQAVSIIWGQARLAAIAQPVVGWDGCNTVAGLVCNHMAAGAITHQHFIPAHSSSLP